MRIKSVISILLSIFVFISCGPDTVKKSDDVYDVIIVGGGGGGLGAAARLTEAGKKVLLIEQHYKVGGYMTNFTRGDYTFEISLHAMDNLDPGRMNVKLLKDLKIWDKLKPVKTDPISVLYFPGFSVILPADVEEYKKLLLDRYPKLKENIEDFYEATENMDIVVNTSIHFVNGDYLTGIWESLKNITAYGTFFKHMNSSTTEFMKDYLKDDDLIGFMSILTGMLGDSLDNVSGILFAGMWNGYHRGGYYYLEGGSQSITDALEENIKKSGGEILTSTLVTKIIIEDGLAVGVKTSDGKTYKCRYVVSNANAPDTFFKLIDKEHLPADYLEDLEKRKIGPSTFLVYLGVNKDYSKYYPGNTHEMMINHTVNAEENFKAWETGDIERLPFGIANYSKVDPKVAPKGKNVMVFTTIMSYDSHDNWFKNESYEKYKKMKEDFAKIMIKRAEKYLPGLSKHIEVMEVATPRTNERYTLNPKGSIFGWANDVENSLWNRLPQDTPIDNLYLAGAWTLPCGGQSVVLLSGYNAAGMILAND